MSSPPPPIPNFRRSSTKDSATGIIGSVVGGGGDNRSVMMNDNSGSIGHNGSLRPILDTQALPLFSEQGTTLDAKQQRERAKKKGLCIRCGIKTHNIMPFRNQGITNSSVYKGHCIKCDPDEIPIRILKEWEEANPDLIHLAKKTDLYPHRGGGMRSSKTGGSRQQHQRSQSVTPSEYSAGGAKDHSSVLLSNTAPVTTLSLDSSKDYGRFVSELEVDDSIQDQPWLDNSSRSQHSLTNDPPSINVMSHITEESSRWNVRGSTASLCTYGTNEESISSSARRRQSQQHDDNKYDQRVGGDEDSPSSSFSSSYENVEETSLSILEEISTKLKSESGISSWLRDFAGKVGGGGNNDHAATATRQQMAQNGGISAVVECMNNHCEHVSIQKYGCDAIRGYAAAMPDGRSYISLLVHKGAIDAIFVAMRQHSQNTGVLLKCLAALLGLSLHGTATRAMAQHQANIPTTVTNAIRQDYSDDAIVHQACQFLKTVAQQEESLREKIASSRDCIDTLVEAMNTHADDGPVQREATGALYQISRRGKHTSGRQYRSDVLLLVNGGAVKSVLAAMSHHSSLDIRSNGCGFLKNLALVDESRQQVSVTGGIPILIAAMRGHPDDTTLQCFACSALKHLCFDETNEVIIGNQGGISTVVAAIQRHRQDMTVLQEACAALRNLSVSDKNRDAIAQHESDIVGLISVMQENLGHAMFQQKACGALRNLSSHPQFRKPISDIGGIATTISVMELHPDDERIQILGCGILRNLSMDKNNRVTLEFGEKGFRAIFASLQNHSTNPKLACQACGALRSATKHAENREVITRLQGIQTIITTMRQHKTEASVQTESFEALLNMSIDKGNSAIVGQLEGIKAIIEAMKHHSRDANLQSWGCGALWNLSASPSNHPYVVEDRADSVVVTAMKCHEKSSAVQKKACLALTSLAAIETCRQYLAENEATDVVIETILRHQKDAQVLKYAFKFLATMLDNSRSKSSISQHESALRQAMKYHGNNPDLTKYSRKVLPS